MDKQLNSFPSLPPSPSIYTPTSENFTQTKRGLILICQNMLNNVYSSKLLKIEGNYYPKMMKPLWDYLKGKSLTAICLECNPSPILNAIVLHSS